MTDEATVRLESGLTLSCATHGDGPEPVVLFHPGPTDSWRSYRPILDLLPAGIRAIAVSPRGHGDSGKPRAGYRIADFAVDVVHLLDALRIDRAVLAGHSGSCLVARRVALDHPTRVAGLLLEAAPATLVADRRLEAFVAGDVADLTDPIDPGFARDFVIGTSSLDLPAALLDELVADVCKVPARVWRAMFTDLLRYDDTSELAGLGPPTQLIWGDGDSLVVRQAQDALTARIPGCELAVYSGAGHTPRWDAPQRFTADVVAFVRRLTPPLTEAAS